MSVIRIKKARVKPYVILDTTALNDSRLSFRAKGLHTYLMSKPDDWQINVEHLASQSPKEGREAVMMGMRELKDNGYTRRRMQRNSKGHVLGSETVIYETPLLAEQDDADEALAKAANGITEKRKTRTSENPNIGLTEDRENRASDSPTFGKSDPILIIDSLPSIESTNPPLPSQTGGDTSSDHSKPPRRPKQMREQPRHDPEGFKRFYAPYPKHTHLQGAIKAWDAMKPSGELRELIIANVEARAKNDPEWLKDDAKYVPNPESYLNNGRWTDEWKPRSHGSKFVF